MKRWPGWVGLGAWLNTMIVYWRTAAHLSTFFHILILNKINEQLSLTRFFPDSSQTFDQFPKIYPSAVKLADLSMFSWQAEKSRWMMAGYLQANCLRCAEVILPSKTARTRETAVYDWWPTWSYSTLILVSTEMGSHSPVNYHGI